MFLEKPIGLHEAHAHDIDIFVRKNRRILDLKDINRPRRQDLAQDDQVAHCEGNGVEWIDECDHEQCLFSKELEANLDHCLGSTRHHFHDIQVQLHCHGFLNSNGTYQQSCAGKSKLLKSEGQSEHAYSHEGRQHHEGGVDKVQSLRISYNNLQILRIYSVFLVHF